MENRRQELKKLTLHRETVRELSEAELTQVGGAIPPWTPVIWTLPLDHCIAVASGNPCCL
jgi:hypothetical protein